MGLNLKEKNNNISLGKNSLDDFKIALTLDEKLVCLHEIADKLKKILYVYDKSLDPTSGYKYKVYCGGIAIFVSSSNYLFDGELVSLIVNLNAILTNDFDKAQIKRLVFESVNFTEFLITRYQALKDNAQEFQEDTQEGIQDKEQELEQKPEQFKVDKKYKIESGC